MDPTLADGLPPEHPSGPLVARLPAWAHWGVLLALPVLIGLLGVYWEQGVERRVWTGRALKVMDGDTLQVSDGVFTRTIRLADVDCPERLQPYGDAATELLRELTRGQTLEVRAQERDKYGRLVATLVLPDGRRVGDVLVQEGLAWFNQRYSTRVELAALEREAKRARRGLWRDRRPQPPWRWRARNR